MLLRGTKEKSTIKNNLSHVKTSFLEFVVEYDKKLNQKGSKGIFKIPVEPSHKIILENPVHKSARSSRSDY